MVNATVRAGVIWVVVINAEWPTSVFRMLAPGTMMVVTIMVRIPFMAMLWHLFQRNYMSNFADSISRFERHAVIAP